jgi:hypothetical protein
MVSYIPNNPILGESNHFFSFPSFDNFAWSMVGGLIFRFSIENYVYIPANVDWPCH